VLEVGPANVLVHVVRNGKDAGDPLMVLADQLLSGFGITPGNHLDIVPKHCRYAVAGALLYREPIRITMITAREDHIALGVGSCNPNIGEVRVFPRLPESHHFTIRDNFMKNMRQFEFQRACLAEEDPFFHLSLYGAVDFVITISERDGAKGEPEVDVFLPLHIPYPAPLSAHDELRHRLVEIGIRPFRVCLRPPGNELQCLPKMRVGLFHSVVPFGFRLTVKVLRRELLYPWKERVSVRSLPELRWSM